MKNPAAEEVRPWPDSLLPFQEDREGLSHVGHGNFRNRERPCFFQSDTENGTRGYSLKTAIFGNPGPLRCETPTVRDDRTAKCSHRSVRAAIRGNGLRIENGPDLCRKGKGRLPSAVPSGNRNAATVLPAAAERRSQARQRVYGGFSCRVASLPRIRNRSDRRRRRYSPYRDPAG